MAWSGMYVGPGGAAQFSGSEAVITRKYGRYLGGGRAVAVAVAVAVAWRGGSGGFSSTW